MSALLRFSVRVALTKSRQPLQPNLLGGCVNYNIYNNQHHYQLNVNQTSHKHTMVDLEPVVQITGAIIPFAEQNFFQKMFFAYNYPLMYYMDFLLDYMPWWGAIVATTITVKLAFFPFIKKQNSIGIKLHNLSPETQKIQEKVNEAMCTGNNYEAAVQRAKMFLLYKEHDVSIMQRLWPSLIQAPMFASIFLLLRRLSSQPVESMLTGGALWFTNLTMPDPLYILPLLTSGTLYLQMKYGFEGSVAPMADAGPIGKWLVRIFPIGIFALTYNFPAAVLLYWTSTNVTTLLYARLFRLKAVKQKLNIPECLQHDPASLPISNTSFKGQIKRAMDASAKKKTSLDVRRLDEIAFRKAGVGPLRKTYKTKPAQSDPS